MSAPSTPTPEPAPFQPLDYTTWEATPEAARITDPLEKIQAFDDRTRKDLFRAGLYDEDTEAEISAAGADQALRAGLISSPEEYAPAPKPKDPSFLARQLINKGDTEKASAIFRYQSFLSRPDTDPETLERARQEAEIDPDTENELTRAAVRKGEIPFAVVPDAEGNAIFEIDPELGQLDREQILDLADTVPGGLDPRFLPALEKQLTRLPGSNFTPAQYRQQAVFEKFLGTQIATDDFLFGQLQEAQQEYDREGQLSTETKESLDRSLTALDTDREFSPATRSLLIEDVIKKGAKPEAFDPEKPENYVQYLADGSVYLPDQVVFDESKYNETLDKLSITPEQKENAKAARSARLDALAPSYVDAMGADPDALEFYEKSKAEGKTDAEIATGWYSKPENYSGFANRARSFGMSLIEAGPGLVQSIGALAGSESAREALMARQQDVARNEEFARLSGDSYGVGQTLLNTSTQVAADLLVGLGVSALATPVAGAAVAGSRAAASALIRGVARTALKEGSIMAARGFLKSGTGTAARTLASMGPEVATALGTQTGIAASSFTRSAGSAYVQAYSALDAQKTPSGQPMFSDAEKRKLALGTAITAGTSTAAITVGFGKLLGPGVEGLVSGKLSTGILRRVYGLTDDQIAAATKSSAVAILSAAGSEAPEEAADQLVGNVIQAIGTGEEFRLGPALKEALEAGLVGGLMGTAVGGIQVGIQKYRSPKVEALEKSGSPASAAALEAKLRVEASTPAPKPTVINQDGLRIQENPPLSPDPFSYGEEDPDAQPDQGSPLVVPQDLAPLSGDLSAGYGDEPAVGITDTAGAVRVSAAEIEGQIDAVDVKLADLKIVPANETEGQKARRTRRLQELNAEKTRLKAAVKNAKASGGFVFLAQERPQAAASPAPAPAAVAQREPGETELDYGVGGELAVQDNTLGGAPAVPEDIIGTDQAPEPPTIESADEEQVVQSSEVPAVDGVAPVEGAAGEVEEGTPQREGEGQEEVTTARKLEDYPTAVDIESFTRYRQSLVENSEDGSGVPGMSVKQYSAAAKKGVDWAAKQLDEIRQQHPVGSSEYTRARDRLQASAQRKTPRYSSLGSRATNDSFVFWKEASALVSAQNSADYFASAIRRGGKRDIEDVLDYKVPEWHLFRAATASEQRASTPQAKKKTTDASAAADMRAGKPIPIHETLFNDTVSQGWVPGLNVLKEELAGKGFGGPKYSPAFREAAVARIRELFPLVPVPKNAETKTLKSLGAGDVKSGGKLASIPVFPDGKTAPFTNDPQITAWQKGVGLSVSVPAGVAVNPAIGVNTKTGTVDFAIDETGKKIYARGDSKRAGTAIGDYVAHQNKEAFGRSLETLPPVDTSLVAKPVDFAGMKILPGETTEDDILRYFFAPPSPGQPSRLEAAVNSRAPKDFTGAQKDSVRDAAQLAFLRELREFTLDVNNLGSVNTAGFGHATTQSYKAYLEDRASDVWRNAMGERWNDRGRPTHLSFFVDTAIKAHADGAARRPDANVQLGSDDVDQATALERAAARNEVDNSPDVLIALDEAFTPEVLRGSASLMGLPSDTGIMEIASGIQILVSRIDTVPALRKAFEQAYIGTLDLPPGPSAKRAVAIQQAKVMDASDLVVLASRSALVQPGVVQAVRDAGFFKSVLYGVNTFTDAEVAAHRAANRAAVSDLKLDGDLRSAIERVARSAKYPRRYRAVMLAALKMSVLPSVSIVDAPAEAYAGSYTQSANLITLNLASSNGRGLLDVLAHELLHAATIEAVANPQTKAAKDLVAKLERARQKAAEVVPEDMAYAVSSLDEFITHAATDPRLQVILRETLEKGKTTWQRVVDAVAKFFGIANGDFVSDLWGFINHAAEYGLRPGVAASREAATVATPARLSIPEAPTVVDPVDQHLPTLPEGLTYDFDDTRPKYLAYARRSNPGAVTVNRAALAAAIEGLDPANARAIVSKVVKHEIAHLAAFSAFTDSDISEMARGLSMAEIGDIARRYYNSPDAMTRLTADLESGAISEAALVEEWLRMQVEMISDGATTEETIAFHSNNPGLTSRILRYIRDFVKSLWTQVAGPTEDYLTRVTINRLMREYRDISRGHMPPEQAPFDPGDPYRDNRLGALATDGGTDPESAVLSDFMRQETFIDYSGAYTEPPKGWRGTLKQILQTRTGDPRFEATKNERTSLINAANTLLANRERLFRKAMKEEKPDRDLVNQALGDKSPTIPGETRKMLRAEFESDLQEVAAKSEEAQIELDVEFRNRLQKGENRDAVLDWIAGEQNKIEADEKAGRQAAYDKYDKAKRQALAETAREKKIAVSEAFDKLRAESPKTADAVKKFRSAIDSMSAVLRDTHDKDSYLYAVLDENMGIYVTQTYKIHHGDADPLAIFKSDDPADIETVAAAQEIFIKTIIEGRTEEIMEEEAEAGKIISSAEAEELARAWAQENDIGRKALENYIASHGGRAFFHGGGNFKLDLTRYMQRADVPEALRKVLGEVNDPVENAARTFANVSYMAANHRFIEDLARGGKSSGALVTKAQKDAFPDLIRDPNEESYIQGTIDNGFARRRPAAGYVEVADGVYHPLWLLEARQNRDFRKLDGYEQLATTNKKYGAGSLDGLYAAPLIKAFFENAMPGPVKLESEKMVQRFGSFFAKATGASLGIATVTNPGFHTRNMLGGSFFLMANGINPFRNLGVTGEHARDLVLNRDNPEITKLISLGIYSNDTRPQAIKELIKEETDKPGDMSGFEWFGSLIGGKRGLAIGQKITTGALKLTDVAGAVDSVVKGMAFQKELDVLRKAHPDWELSKAERAAADIVLRTMQARSMTVPLAEDVTRSSFGRLFSPFLRFRAEMFRVTHGTIAQSLEEMRSDNPVIQARGKERMAGFVAVSTLSLAGPAFVSALFGVGEDEEKALRESLPPYLKGNSLTYVVSNGSVTSLDMTFVNPYSNLFDPISRTSRAMFRGEPGEAAGEIATWMSAQLLDEQIAAGAALEVLNNRTSDNKPIVLETDGFVDSTVKYTKHLLGSAYTPQVLKILDRAVEAQRRGVPESAEMFETPAGLLASTILPVRGRTFQTSDMALRAFKSKAQTLRDIRTLSGQYKRRQNLDGQDIDGITEDIHDSMVSLYEDLDQIARGYEGLGLARPEIIKQMVNAGHSREKARGVVVMGYVPAPSLTPATRRDIFDAGEAVDPNGGGERRVKLVLGSQKALPRTIDLGGPVGD